MRRREPRRDAVAVPHEHHGIVHARRVDDGGEVVGPLVEDRPVPVDDRVGQPGTAAVEHHDAPERAQSFEQPNEAGVVVEQFHGDEAPGHHHDVGARIARRVGGEYPKGDVCAVAGPRVLDLAHDP